MSARHCARFVLLRALAFFFAGLLVGRSSSLAPSRPCTRRRCCLLGVDAAPAGNVDGAVLSSLCESGGALGAPGTRAALVPGAPAASVVVPLAVPSAAPGHSNTCGDAAPGGGASAMCLCHLCLVIRPVRALSSRFLWLALWPSPMPFLSLVSPRRLSAPSSILTRSSAGASM
eukprot:IDg14147t1